MPFNLLFLDSFLVRALSLLPSSGDLSFWFRDSRHDHNGEHPTGTPSVAVMEIIADWRESCTVLCDWSPDGRHFHTASVYPRMKVDNQFKIFDFEGREVAVKSFLQLLDFQWKPDVMAAACGVPPVPTQQKSALVAIQKFRTVQDLANDVKHQEAERYATRTVRARHRETMPGRAVATTDSGGRPGATSATATSKAEKNRDFDLISDWRAGRRWCSIWVWLVVWLSIFVLASYCTSISLFLCLFALKLQQLAGRRHQTQRVNRITTTANKEKPLLQKQRRRASGPAVSRRLPQRPSETDSLTSPETATILPRRLRRKLQRHRGRLRIERAFRRAVTATKTIQLEAVGRPKGVADLEPCLPFLHRRRLRVPLRRLPERLGV